MNYRLILQFLGSLLQFEGAFLLLPFLVGLYYHESQAKYLLIIAAAAAAIAVTRQGAAPAIPDWKETQDFLARQSS